MKDEAISRNPGILGGTPVFAGTRVPVRNLVDCLEGGYSIDEFLEDFPTVRREQAIAVLEEASIRLELATLREGGARRVPAETALSGTGGT